MVFQILIIESGRDLFNSLFATTFERYPVITGCAGTVAEKTKLDKLFETDFAGFNLPDAAWIKQGKNKEFPYTTFDRVWDSAMLVFMQQGIMVRASKEQGVIAAITQGPLAVYIEKGEVVNVYLNCMDDLYRNAEKSNKLNKQKSTGCPDILNNSARYFDKLSTQVYEKEKCKYLDKESRNE